MEKDTKRLQINLLGVPQLLLDGAPVDKKTLSKKKASAILYYLATTQTETTREHLGLLLWGDQPQDRAGRSVRGRAGLWHLRNNFGAHFETGNPAYIKGDFSVDVAEFEAIITTSNPTIEQLRQQVALYRGTFLDQFSVEGEGTLEFEMWMLERRERYRTFVLNALQKLVIYYTDWQEYDDAFQYVEQLLEIESWSEAAHRFKMRLLAYQGQRGEALKQYERCHALLRENLAVDPDVETQALFEDIRDNRLQLPSAIPFAVPPEPPRFIGRNGLMKTLASSLEPSQKMPIVALCGMGGVGKTTLATQLGHNMRKSFKDGVLWGNVSESDPSDIIESWVRFYDRDVATQSDLATRKVVWNAVAARRTILIVLDGVESAEQVRPLLPSSPHSVVLLTTRNRDSAEALHAQMVDVPVFDLAESKRLLHHILADGVEQDQTEWSLAETASAETICNLLEQLPLAIEIVGHRLRSRRHLTLARVAEQLQKLSRLDYLNFSDKAVRVSFELSWQFLSEAQRTFFATLSIFNGQPFTLETATHVAGLDSDDAAEHLDELSALSLIQTVGSTHQRQHALLAEFASEKASELALDIPEIAGRFATFYYHFSQTHADNYSQLKHEWGNITRAIDIAHSQKSWRRVCDHVQLMIPVWERRGRYAEAQVCYALSRTAAQQLPDDATEAHVLERWGFSLVQQANFDTALPHLQESLILYKAVNDELGVSNVQAIFGRIYVDKGEYEESHQRLTEALDLKKKLGDEVGSGRVLYSLSWLNVRNGMYDDAETFIRQSLDVQDGLDENGFADSLRYLASINIYKRNPIDALPFCKRALEKFRALGNKPELAMTLYTMAAILTRLERYKDAKPVIKEAFDLFRQMGNVKFEALSAREEALIALRQGLPKKALLPTLHAERHLRILDDKRNLPFVLGDLGRVYVGIGDVDNARLALNEALDLAKSERLIDLMKVLAERLQDLEKAD